MLLSLPIPFIPVKKCLRGYFERDDGEADPLNLIVEIKGYRGENAKEKANTMRAYWVPGVNNLGKFGRWQFAEFTSVYEIESDFKKLTESISKAPSKEIEP